MPFTFGWGISDLAASRDHVEACYLFRGVYEVTCHRRVLKIDHEICTVHVIVMPPKETDDDLSNPGKSVRSREPSRTR